MCQFHDVPQMRNETGATVPGSLPRSSCPCWFAGRAWLADELRESQGRDHESSELLASQPGCKKMDFSKCTSADTVHLVSVPQSSPTN